jgi:hypothetical protein
MSTPSSTTPKRTALRTPYAIAGWLIVILMIAMQTVEANVALRSHAAVHALRFLLMLPLTLSWTFIMSLCLPAKTRHALIMSLPKPGIGTAIILYLLFASFMTNYGFK